MTYEECKAWVIRGLEKGEYTPMEEWKKQWGVKSAPLVCECGATKCKQPRHSTWCPVHKEEK